MAKNHLQPIRKTVEQKANVAENVKAENSEITEVNLGFEIDRNRVYIFETIKKSDIPRNENLGAQCMAFDNIEKRYRSLRYHPTAESIFADEQHESFDELPLPALGFYRNVLYVQGEDLRKMEYLLNHPLYEHSPFRVANKPAFYTLADKELQEEIKAKRHATEMKALQLIADTDIEEIKPIARSIFAITETTDTAIINALNELVKKPRTSSEKSSNAERFIENVGNPKLLRTYRIQSGIDKGLIAADMNQNKVTWVDGGAYICELKTKDPVKELVDFTFSDDGGRFYTTLQRKLKD